MIKRSQLHVSEYVHVCTTVERVEVPIEVHSQDNISATSSPLNLSPTLIKQLRIINELRMIDV